VSGDYLWDRSGEPDPEVVELEEQLGSLAYRPDPLRLPETGPPRRSAWGGWGGILAAAAALVAALAGSWPQRPSTWEVTRLVSGTGTAPSQRLATGEWLVTDAHTRAQVKIGLIGRVEVEPSTRVQVVDAGWRTHRLALRRGTLHARIWAPPGRFFVDTPSAVAVDLGCAYTLDVDAEGVGRLSVEIGWVGFEWRGRESFVPAGAVCSTRPDVGPGTPHYDDASKAFTEALARLDFGGAQGDRAEDLRRVLAEARARDALSLWHLLSRLPAVDREAVYDRFAQLVPPPAGVTRAGVVAGNQAMLDRWWGELDLGSAGFWRLWTAPWPPR
jgi:hypothetical protein